MENFRQFFGEHTVKFSTGNNNITIILGQNGMGKTGIFRALIFGLYGSRYLPQDNKKDEIHLVNIKALEEGKPVVSTVKIYIKNKEETIVIVRSIKGVKYNNKIIEEPGDVYLDYISRNGDYKAKYETDKIKIEKIINDLLDEKIKDFFFFDGEKIETLARTDRKVKEEVKAGIIKLMQIDKLEKAISITNSLLRKESDKIRERSANIDLENKNKEIIGIENEIVNKEEILELKEKNLIAVNEEINNTKEKLDENKVIREMSREADNIIKEKNSKLDTLGAYKQILDINHFQNAHKLVMSDYYKITKDQLKQILIDQDELVPIEVLETSLDTGYCVCCNTDLEKDINAKEFLMNLKSNHRRSRLSHLMSNIISRVEDFEKKRDKVNKELRKTLERINIEKKAIERLDKDLIYLNDQIKEYSRERENLKHLENMLNDKEKLQKDEKVQIEILNNEIKTLEKKLNDLRRKYNLLLKENSENEYEAKRLEIIQNLNNNLKETFNEYSMETRNILSEETSNVFKRLIDEKDLNLINEIKINDKYEIEIYERSNIKITQDISQGQRQIVALSFITSLAKIADKGSGQIDFPLFMDTPFGRISKKNRENLIRNIPDLTQQWVLLLTDTEFTDFEKGIFEREGRVGKIYEIKQIEPGYSTIEEA